MSSSKHAILTNIPELEERDIAICCAYMGCGMFGFGADKEKEEHRLSLLCKEMAKTVAISKPDVFIGEDPKDLNSALVEYREEKQTPITESFFTQWEQYKLMLMEFQLVDLQGNPIFVLRGLWDKDHWQGLDIYPEANITVVPTR